MSESVIEEHPKETKQEVERETEIAKILMPLRRTAMFMERVASDLMSDFDDQKAFDDIVFLNKITEAWTAEQMIRKLNLTGLLNGEHAEQEPESKVVGPGSVEDCERKQDDSGDEVREEQQGLEL